MADKQINITLERYEALIRAETTLNIIYEMAKKETGYQLGNMTRVILLESPKGCVADA